jgi:hypothetical protein
MYRHHDAIPSRLRKGNVTAPYILPHNRNRAHPSFHIKYWSSRVRCQCLIGMIPMTHSPPHCFNPNPTIHCHSSTNLKEHARNKSFACHRYETFPLISQRPTRSISKLCSSPHTKSINSGWESSTFRKDKGEKRASKRSDGMMTLLRWGRNWRPCMVYIRLSKQLIIM